MQPEFSDLLSPEILLSLVEKSGVYAVTVKETGAEAKLKSLEITGLAQDDLAFTLDYQPSGGMSACFKQLSCYLNVGQEKINKGCDFVLVTKRKGGLCVLLGELKSNKPKEREVKEQLKNS